MPSERVKIAGTEIPLTKLQARLVGGCEHYQDVDECTGWAAAVCWTKCAGH